MTYVAHTSALPRLVASFLSASIPVAIGIAMLVNLPSGMHDIGGRPGKRGNALVVELLPLSVDETPAGDAKSGADTPREDGSALHRPGAGAGPHRVQQVQPIGALSHGDGGDGEDSSSIGAKNQPDAAPVMSGADIQTFRAHLLQHIERFQQYPKAARIAQSQGVVRIQFVMDRAGNVSDAWVESSSGSRILDEEAIAAVMRARPLPTPPAGWPQSFGVTLPIGFSLQ